MSFGEHFDSTLDPMEEIRFLKKHYDLTQRLLKKLHFNLRELQSLMIIYYKLLKASGSGSGHEKLDGVTKRQLRVLLHCALDMTDDKLMDRIFAVFERFFPVISLEKFLIAMSVLLRGTLEEKIDFCFAVYDYMGEGFVTRDQIYYLLDNSLISTGGDEDLEEQVKDMIDILIKKMDLDRDGKISYNDYKESVLQEPMMLEIMGECLPSRAAVHTFMSVFAPKVRKL